MESKETAEPRFIVVIGASAGGLNSLIQLMAQMTEEVDLSIFVVLHAPNAAYSDLVIQRLQKNTVFTCKLPEHEEKIKNRHMYMAIPDMHLIVKQGQIMLGRGATENRWRPSIDVLFRSAAVAYDSRAIGVILTGLLEDGTSGMAFIKECGGTCIVQDPDEAEYPDMPMSVLRNVKVDYCTTLERIGIILIEKAKNGAKEKHAIPQHLMKEAEVAERIAIGIEDVTSLGGKQSVYSCPECGGSLWEFQDQGITRYRCFTGHSFTGSDLLESKRQELKSTFWVALRILEERHNLLKKMAEEENSKGWIRSSENKRERAEELRVHIGRLKQVLFEATDDPEPTRLELEGD